MKKGYMQIKYINMKCNWKKVFIEVETLLLLFSSAIYEYSGKIDFGGKYKDNQNKSELGSYYYEEDTAHLHDLR